MTATNGLMMPAYLKLRENPFTEYSKVMILLLRTLDIIR